jgi:hypothetical protein
MGVRLRTAQILVVAGVSALVLTGCGESSVPASDVEEQTSDQLSQQYGEEFQDVSCPEDLPAEEDAEITCELTYEDETRDVAITVTSVEDDTVNFDIQVADTPN